VRGVNGSDDSDNHLKMGRSFAMHSMVTDN
jgi:hypothetical protein